MNIATLAPVARVTRRLAATPEQVFDAWTDPQKFRHWMAPGDTHVSSARADLRVGGAFEVVMSNSTKDLPHHGVYLAIDRPHRVVFTWESHATGPEPSVVTLELKAVEGGTELTLTHEKLPADQIKGHTWGWTGIADNIETWLQAGAPS